jgi:hypothetical protein
VASPRPVGRTLSLGVLAVNETYTIPSSGI